MEHFCCLLLESFKPKCSSNICCIIYYKYSLNNKIFIKQHDIEIELLIPTVIETKKGFYEEVADINGIALQSIYYDTLENSFDNEKRSNILLQMILESIAMIPSDSHTYLQELVEDLPNYIENIGDYIYMANIYIAIQERLYFKLIYVLTDIIVERKKIEK